MLQELLGILEELLLFLLSFMYENQHKVTPYLQWKKTNHISLCK